MSKLPNLPPDVAQRFMFDMQAFHSEPNARKRDEIAATTLRLVRQHYGSKLSVTNVKDLFNKLHDVVA